MSDQEHQLEIQTLRNPMLYSPRQITRALMLARTLDAGVFYLLEHPKP